MSPVVQASLLYPDVTDFHRHLESHLLYGYVFSTPDAFGLGRPVCSSAPTAEIIDPRHIFPREQCDAWWISLATGDLVSLFQFFPFELPLIGWQRYWKGRPAPKFYRVESALAKLEKIHHSARHGDRA